MDSSLALQMEFSMADRLADAKAVKKAAQKADGSVASRVEKLVDG